MAVPFVFVHRRLGYQTGCGLLLLATMLGVFGVASPGWYSVQETESGMQFYTHLWIVCSHGLSGCNFLRPGITAGRERERMCECVCVCVCV